MRAESSHQDRKKRGKRFLVQKIIFSIFRVRPEYYFMGVKNLFLYWLFQRVFRINSHVAWPVHWSSVVLSPDKIKFTHETNPLGFSIGSYIQAKNGIQVGSNLIHGPRISIISSNHDLNDFAKRTGSKPVIVGDNCWLGANVVLLPEVHLGDHTIVAAGSVVTKPFPEGNCVLAGIPARVIKKIGCYAGEHYFLDKH